MRPSTVFLLVPAVVIAAIVAVANRGLVTVSLDPFSDTHPAIVLQMPLYVLVFLTLLLGVILGALATALGRAVRRSPRASRAPESIERALVPVDTAKARDDSSPA